MRWDCDLKMFCIFIRSAVPHSVFICVYIHFHFCNYMVIDISRYEYEWLIFLDMNTTVFLFTIVNTIIHSSKHNIFIFKVGNTTVFIFTFGIQSYSYSQLVIQLYLYLKLWLQIQIFIFKLVNMDIFVFIGTTIMNTFCIYVYKYEYAQLCICSAICVCFDCFKSSPFFLIFYSEFVPPLKMV